MHWKYKEEEDMVSLVKNMLTNSYSASGRCSPQECAKSLDGKEEGYLISGG